MKVCKKCNKKKSLDNFYKSGQYYKSYCKNCFNKYHSNIIKKYKGVYGIFEDNKCLYVGESSRVNERMSKHRVFIKNIELTKHNPTQSYLYQKLSNHKNVVVKLLERTDNHKEQEKYYINKLKPLYSAFTK